MADSKTLFAIGATHWPGVSKVVEEAGEVVQVAGKLMATYGEARHWGDGDLVQRLTEEVGDLLAAIDFLIAHNAILDPKLIDRRRRAKRDTFEKWHHEQGKGRDA